MKRAVNFGLSRPAGLRVFIKCMSRFEKYVCFMIVAGLRCGPDDGVRVARRLFRSHSRTPCAPISRPLPHPLRRPPARSRAWPSSRS
ncbi:hypothetical protein BCEP4_560023 [Burkholderia cepacia]|nr:hypothetical protein BCEP4_560023 [Burkholderia cepacia]